jgi:hypothetical protein
MEILSINPIKDKHWAISVQKIEEIFGFGITSSTLVDKKADNAMALTSSVIKLLIVLIAIANTEIR